MAATSTTSTDTKLEGELKLLNDTIQSLTDNVAEYNTNKESIGKIENDLSQNSSSLQKINDEINDLITSNPTQDLHDLQDEKKKLEDEKNKLEDEKNKLESQIQALEKTLGGLEQTIHGLEKEVFKNIAITLSSITNIRKFFAELSKINQRFPTIKIDKYIYIEQNDSNHYFYVITELNTTNDSTKESIKYTRTDVTKTELTLTPSLTNINVDNSLTLTPTTLDEFNQSTLANKSITPNKVQRDEYVFFLNNIHSMSIKPQAYYNLTRLYNTEYNDVYVLIETYTLYCIIRLKFTDKNNREPIVINKILIYEKIPNNVIDPTDTTIGDMVSFNTLYEHTISSPTKGGGNISINKPSKKFTQKIHKKKKN